MVVKVYGHPMTACTQRVVHMCKEAGIAYEFIPVDVARGAHRTDEFAEKAPFKLIPYIDDDGFIMYESRAIGRYLATKSGKFLPSSSDPHTTARFEQAMSIEATNFDPYAFGLVREIILGPTHWGKEIDPVNVDRLTTLLENRLHGHERVLSRQRYLAGDELTIADFYHLPFGMLLLEMGIPFFEDAEKYPNLIRWWKEISVRPAWKEVAEMRKGWFFD